MTGPGEGMRVLVLLAHPKPESFNAAILKAFVGGLVEAGHEPDVADLYKEDFRPALSSEDLTFMGREAPDPAVRAYQARILAAQGLAFLFPVWWFGPPAMLKGFVDRVFQENFAFRFKEGGLVEGLLRHRRALVLNTTGASALLYRTFGFGKPLQQSFCDWTLRFCGIKEVEQVLFHEVVNTDDAARAKYLVEARRLGREFFSN